MLSEFYIHIMIKDIPWIVSKILESIPLNYFFNHFTERDGFIGHTQNK